MEKIKWMYNGIKVGKKLYKAHYARFVPVGENEEQITVYARDLMAGLPKILPGVQNDSDGMTDYFETDRLRISQKSEFWNDAVAAMKKVDERNIRLKSKISVEGVA